MIYRWSKTPPDAPKWCTECNEPIFYPRIQRNDNGVGDVWDEEVCPHCGELLDEADTCPLCGEPKYSGAVLCPSCKEQFTADFDAFVRKWRNPTTDTELDEIMDIIGEIYGV